MEEKQVVEIKESKLAGKIPGYFPYLLGFCLLIWLGLLMDRVFGFQEPFVISKFIAQIEFIVHFFILIASFKILQAS